MLNLNISLMRACSLIVICVLALTLSGCYQETRTTQTVNAPQGGSYQQMTGEEAATIIEQGNCTVVDVRGEVDYDLGHIEGAIVIPLDEIDENPAIPVDQLTNKDATIVVYCDYGGLSKTAAERLAAKGYTNVINFDGLKVWEGKLATS